MSVEADWFLRAHPDITTIEALLPDCNGVMRGKWLPRHKLTKVYQGEIKLPITALSLDIWGRDVEELVFESGDADGICALIQLRKAEPREASLITGVKRDINLLAKVEAVTGDQITVLDVSMDSLEGRRICDS